MLSIREPDEKERTREILEGVFRAAEIKSVPESATLREDYLVAKKLVLDGAVKLDQVIQKRIMTMSRVRMGISALIHACK